MSIRVAQYLASGMNSARPCAVHARCKILSAIKAEEKYPAPMLLDNRPKYGYTELTTCKKHRRQEKALESFKAARIVVEMRV
jgi:hypothetical protein